MDSRLIFLHLLKIVISCVRTHQEVLSVALKLLRWLAKADMVGKSAVLTSRPAKSFDLYRNDLNTFRCQEKCRSQIFNKPYRKPTQVGKLSILRRAGKLSLRNSAKKLGVS